MKMFIVFLSVITSLLLSPESRAEETKCYFPDIPSFSEGKTLPDGRSAELSLADYRISNPKGAALLMHCARNIYKSAKLSQFDSASRKRLDRAMETSWADRDTFAAAKKDGYTSLGGSSNIGRANGFGMMIIGPDKKLVAIGLLFNDGDKIDDDQNWNHFYTNISFMYNTSPFKENNVSVETLNSILNIINPEIDSTFIFENKYFIDSKF